MTVSLTLHSLLLLPVSLLSLRMPGKYNLLVAVFVSFPFVTDVFPVCRFRSQDQDKDNTLYGSGSNIHYALKSTNFHNVLRQSNSKVN